jgi:flagellar basal body-associated protein FliL
MADATKPNSSADAATALPSKTAWWKSLLTPRWLVVFIAVSLVIHGAIFILVRRAAARPAPPAEYTVGAFALTAGAPGELHALPGKFELHVRFIDDLQSQATARMVNHQFRVREAVENLLRKSRGIELDELAIARLKHQIQAQINEAIDLHAVAEVMITDLTLPVFSEVQPAPSQNAAVSQPVTVPTATIDQRATEVTGSTPPATPGD